MNDLVTVAVFTYPHEMAVVRAHLESEDITCFAQDEHTVAANPFYSNLVGGIKLQVRAGDVSRAREILLDAGVLAFEHPRPVSEKDTGSPGSSVTSFPLIPVLIGLTMLLALWLLINA